MMAHQRGFRVALAVVVATLVVTTSSAAVADSPTDASIACRAESVPVQVAGLASHLGATLCTPGTVSGRTLQILIPGYTYGQVYWDFPVQPARYSYVRAVTAAGYATLDIDRLGIGSSGYPPALDVTFDAQVSAVEQLVQAVRAGVLGADVGRIVLVGHSYGSAVASAVAVEYRDVDGLILTGYSHLLGAGVAAFFAGATEPAQLDPRFADRPLGYLTTIPGARARLFYAPGTYDPVIAAADEATKQTLTPVEIAGLGLVLDRLDTRTVDVPVLIAAGDEDAVVCGTPVCMAAERAFWSPAAQLETLTMPSTGHDLNLSYTAPQWFADAIDWANRHLGASS